jgi:hypothetical protein
MFTTLKQKLKTTTKVMADQRTTEEIFLEQINHLIEVNGIAQEIERMAKSAVRSGALSEEEINKNLITAQAVLYCIYTEIAETYKPLQQHKLKQWNQTINAVSQVI